MDAVTAMPQPSCCKDTPNGMMSCRAWDGTVSGETEGSSLVCAIEALGRQSVAQNGVFNLAGKSLELRRLTKLTPRLLVQQVKGHPRAYRR